MTLVSSQKQSRSMESARKECQQSWNPAGHVERQSLKKTDTIVLDVLWDHCGMTGFHVR